VAQHFDTSSTSSGTIIGGLAPGLDLSKLYICIELSNGSTPAAGDSVTVRAYYIYSPVTHIDGITGTIGLTASAEWQVE
jgi:hypothetical protein